MPKPVTTNAELWRLLLDAKSEIDNLSPKSSVDADFDDCLATLALALHAAAVGADQLRVHRLDDGERYTLGCTPRLADIAQREHDDINVFARLRDLGPQQFASIAEGSIAADATQRFQRTHNALHRLMTRGYVVSDARGYYALTLAAAQRGRL